MLKVFRYGEGVGSAWDAFLEQRWLEVPPPRPLGQQKGAIVYVIGNYGARSGSNFLGLFFFGVFPLRFSKRLHLHNTAEGVSG